MSILLTAVNKSWEPTLSVVAVSAVFTAVPVIAVVFHLAITAFDVSARVLVANR